VQRALMMVLLVLPGLLATASFSDSYPPTTETLALAARYYLFCAGATTEGIVAVPLSRIARPILIRGSELRQYETALIWWPGKSLGSEETSKCAQLFSDSSSRTQHSIADMRRDRAVYNLCAPSMSKGVHDFQQLRVNEAFLERLRGEFPGTPVPLGVHIVSRLLIRDVVWHEW